MIFAIVLRSQSHGFDQRALISSFGNTYRRTQICRLYETRKANFAGNSSQSPSTGRSATRNAKTKHTYKWEGRPDANNIFIATLSMPHAEASNAATDVRNVGHLQ